MPVNEETTYGMQDEHSEKKIRIDALGIMCTIALISAYIILFGLQIYIIFLTQQNSAKICIIVSTALMPFSLIFLLIALFTKNKTTEEQAQSIAIAFGAVAIALMVCSFILEIGVVETLTSIIKMLQLIIDIINEVQPQRPVEGPQTADIFKVLMTF